MRFLSIPQEVEAVQWTGDFDAIVDFLHPSTITGGTDGPVAIRDFDGLKLLAGKDGAQGWVAVPEGHWIVRNPGDLTDHWPVDPDYFAGKYEPIIEAAIHAYDCDSVDCRGECDEDVRGEPI